ncbi:MAG TPA: carbon-nitrogen hydrolase family protein [Planctomycetota bacterium]|nr:carbon-nitrogen hydrolase family protein [Planctomycetota bacterium]
MKKIVVAGIQIAAIPQKIEANIEKSIAWLEKAILKTRAMLYVFPESMTTGFTPGMPVEQLWELVDVIPGKTTEAMCAVAKQHKVYVVWTTYERGPKKNIVYNSAILIGPTGCILGVYRKTHPFCTEQSWTTAGDSVCVVETEIGKIGIMICYDGDFPELARVMAIKGAEIIVRPSAFLRSADIWALTNEARAYDNHTYIVAVNAVGTDAGGIIHFGNSMIVSPIAQCLAQARSQEEIVFAKIDPNPLQTISYGIDSPMLLNHMQDRNIKVYEEILQDAPSPFPTYCSSCQPQP